VRVLGIVSARPTPEVVHAFASAEVVVIAPSNPIVSVGPILAVPGMRQAIDTARGRGVPVAAISGIVGGVALKGPADRMLSSLGEESSALGVARRYAGLVDLFVMDEVDAPLAPAIEELGMRVLVTATVMTDDDARAALARRTIDAAHALLD
jgi:LPPG:FO 2-phospho-L-lactate transferase